MAVPSGTQTNTNSNVQQYASLYVGDLDTGVTEAALYEVFNAVGPVASIRVCRDTVSRRSLGYAYVNFHSIQDAERALNSLNYTPIKGRACRIMWSHKDPALRRSGHGNVFVRNLDKSIDNKALFDTFSLFGTILSCKVATDPDGKSRGFGFVHYETDESAKAAIEKLNGMQLGDKIVFVGAFQKQAERNDTCPKIFSNIYIKQIPASYDEGKIREMFEKFGPVTSTCFSIDAKNRRFAFVNYEKFEDAAKAVEEMHGKDIRSDEEKEHDEMEKEARKLKAEAEGTEFVDEDENVPEGEVPSNQLYVARAQSKAERLNNLKNRFSGRSSSGKGAPVTSPMATQGCNLYVKNLGEGVDDAHLKELFSPYGTITSARVMTDPSTNVSRGFGFVCFSTPEEATKAVTEMHLKLMYGKPLYVGLHEKKEERMERLQQQFRSSQPGMPGAQFGMRGFGPQGFPPQNQMMFNGSRPGMPGAAPFPGQGFGPMGVGPRPGMPGMMGGFPATGPRPGIPYGAPQMAPQMRAPPPMGMFPGKGKGGPMMPPQPGMPQAPRPPTMQPPVVRPGFPPGMPRPAGGFDAGAPLTAAGLAAAPPTIQKQMLGEKLFPLVARLQPDLAGKITGMMLEMDNSELLILLESETQLKLKVEEALRVLEGR